MLIEEYFDEYSLLKNILVDVKLMVNSILYDCHNKNNKCDKSWDVLLEQFFNLGKFLDIEKILYEKLIIKFDKECVKTIEDIFQKLRLNYIPDTKKSEPLHILFIDLSL